MANTSSIFKGAFAKILASAGINLETTAQWLRYSNNSQTLDVKAPTLVGSYVFTYPVNAPAANGYIMEFTTAGSASFVAKPAGVTASYSVIHSSDPGATIAHGLGGLPDMVFVGYEDVASSADFRPQVIQNFLTYDTVNLNTDFSALTISATNRLHVTALRF